jgi:hypothetical protein
MSGMNRIKVWVYALVVAAVAYVALREHTQQQRAAAMGDLDARLAAASAHVLASTRAIAWQAGAAAALAARDPKLLAALHAAEASPPAAPVRKGRALRAPAPPSVDPDAQDAALRDAARAALAAAERTIGLDLPEGTAATAGNREWLARRSKTEGESMSFLRGAIGGKAQRAYVRQNGAVFYAAAAPAGDGAGVVVLAPVDEAWVRGVAGATGALVTLSVPDAKAISTAGAEAQAFSGWTKGAGVPADVGQLGKTPFALAGLKIGALPTPFDNAPGFRARAVQLDGLKGGFVVAAVPARPALGAIAQLHWQVVLGIAVALLLGVVLGFFVHASEAPAAVPQELLAAAQRIDRGDFAARVPPLAGKFGTVATALNRAAELAGPAAAAQTARASPTDEFFAKPVPSPAARPPPPEPAIPPPEPPAPAPALLESAARAAPAPAAAPVDEESHFQQVFQEFLRARASCGEPSEGLTYEKFRVKLDGNKAALVAKYACKTVRFQVYVKDGKAALKATPVK